MESLRVWQYQEDSTPNCCKRTLKKSKFNGAKSGHKKIVLIAQILFLCHELSVFIDSELHQGLSCILNNCLTYLDVKIWYAQGLAGLPYYCVPVGYRLYANLPNMPQGSMSIV